MSTGVYRGARFLCNSDAPEYIAHRIIINVHPRVHAMRIFGKPGDDTRNRVQKHRLYLTEWSDTAVFVVRTSEVRNDFTIGKYGLKILFLALFPRVWENRYRTKSSDRLMTCEHTCTRKHIIFYVPRKRGFTVSFWPLLHPSFTMRDAFAWIRIVLTVFETQKML